MINEKYAKQFCKDDITKIENYDKAIADTEKTWHCHHRLELTLNNEFAHTRQELIRLEMYYNRPYFELIFLTETEHKSLHGEGKSEITKTKASKSLTGKKYKNGKTTKEINFDLHKDISKSRNFNNETKLKMSKSAKKRGTTIGNTGMHWYNNGKENVLCFEPPKGYVKGRKCFN